MEGWQLLTDEERAYFSAFESMFSSDGWRQLLREQENEVKGLPEQTFWEAKDYDDIVQARVRLTLLLELQHYEEIVERRKNELIMERQHQLQEAVDSQRSLQ